MTDRPAYQLEPEHLRERIWQRGSITPLELMRIAAWKSAKGLAPLALNTEAAITDRTAGALAAILPWRHATVLTDTVDWRAWEDSVLTAVGSKQHRTGLLALEGFGYPMATAFLALLVPAAFPVIDRWTVAAIYGTAGVGNYQRARVYAHFTKTLSGLRAHFPSCSSIHELDQAVMTAAMNAAKTCRHDARPCPCLPFELTPFPT